MKWGDYRRGQRRARAVLVYLAVLIAVSVIVVRLSKASKGGPPRVSTWSKLQPPYEQPAYEQPTPPATRPRQVFGGAPSTSSPNTESSTPPTPDVTVGKLIIPVAGIGPDQLRDTFSEGRSEGRVHDAIDIPAPLGTPVLAAADGKILKLAQNARGGTTIYQLSVDQKIVYYYAHLNRYADGLTVDHFAKQGEAIAYVGATGNAGAGNYHLHFSIAVISDPKRYWEGVNIDPYPLLRR